MNQKEELKIKNKIAKIKKILADDKRHWGGSYHDGYGYRYLQPELYLALQDYVGALRYFKWFEKNFPEDFGPPLFLFEWTITLYKTGKIKDAERKAFQTFVSDFNLLIEFTNKEFLKYESKKIKELLEIEWIAEPLVYKKEQENLQDFTDWLNNLISSERFKNLANEFIEIELKIKDEPVGNSRNRLFEKKKNLLDKYQ